jgi:hypothetical protein
VKKTLAIILAVVFIVALAGTVYAETQFKIGGDARIRGVYQKNYDFNADSKNDNRFYDYRIRLAFDATADGGTAVHTRLVVTDWNEKWGTTATSQDSASGSNGAAVEADYAYIDVPLGKDLMLTAGKVVVNWGNKFMSWDTRAMRIILGYKMGDTTIKAFTQKQVDTLGAADSATHDNLGDKDAYSVLAVHSTKALTVGGIYVYSKDDQTKTDTSLNTFDVYGNFKAGAFGIFGELVYKTGDMLKGTLDGDDQSQYGGFAHATYALGNTTLHGAFAFAKNGYDADDDFTPTFLYGTSQVTGLLNFGNLGDTMAYVLAVDHNLTPDVNLMGKIAYAKISDYLAAETEASVTEFDLGLTYKINKSTTYNIDLAYGKLGGDMGKDSDAAIALANRIQVNF